MFFKVSGLILSDKKGNMTEIYKIPGITQFYEILLKHPSLHFICIFFICKIFIF